MYITISILYKNGGIPIILVLCNFLRKFMVSDKKSHRAFRTHTTLYIRPIREIFHFHYLPKLYFGFNFDIFLVASQPVTVMCWAPPACCVTTPLVNAPVCPAWMVPAATPVSQTPTGSATPRGVWSATVMSLDPKTCSVMRAGCAPVWRGSWGTSVTPVRTGAMGSPPRHA